MLDSSDALCEVREDLLCVKLSDGKLLHVNLVLGIVAEDNNGLIIDLYIIRTTNRKSDNAFRFHYLFTDRVDVVALQFNCRSLNLILAILLISVSINVAT